MKKGKVDEETNAETWTPSNKRREMNALLDYISHPINVSKVLNADLNFPKIHLITHWVNQIPRYGALQQYSAGRHENAHNKHL